MSEPSRLRGARRRSENWETAGGLKRLRPPYGTVWMGWVQLPRHEAEHPASVRPSSPSAIAVEQLARWRQETAGLDKLAARDTDRRALVSVIDVSVVGLLLDEVDRLRRELVYSCSSGPKRPFETLCRQLWRAHALGATETGLECSLRQSCRWFEDVPVAMWDVAGPRPKARACASAAAPSTTSARASAERSISGRGFAPFAANVPLDAAALC